MLCVFGLLVALLPDLSVPSEEVNLQALEKIRLVRTENFEQSLDLHPRRPQLVIKVPCVLWCGTFVPWCG